MTNPISGLGLQASPINQIKATNAAGNSTSNQVENTGNDDDMSLRDQINEVGFRQFAENIKQEKLDEIREKILESMGLDEESLANLPGEQRNNIEEMITREITARMQAAKEMREKEDDEPQKFSLISGTANSYQMSNDGQRVNAGRQEKAEPLFFSFFA